MVSVALGVITCSEHTKGGLMGWFDAFFAYLTSVGLASAPDLPGVNLDADSEEFDLLDMPLLGVR